MTINQLEEFVKKAKTVQEKLMIKCMLKLGMRVSELINFQVDWINFKDAIINIQINQKPIKWTPKYLSVREVPISENLLTELKQYIGNRKHSYVFKSRKSTNNNRYSEQSIIRIINRISRETLGKTIGTHVFRRSYASYLSNEGYDLVQIKKLLGHSDIRTTFLYLQDIPDRKDYENIRNMAIMNL